MRKKNLKNYLIRKQIWTLIAFGMLSTIILGNNIRLVFSLNPVIIENDSISSIKKIYTFHTSNGTTEIDHKLYVSIPRSLYNYYKNKNHNLFNISEYSNFPNPGNFPKTPDNQKQTTKIPSPVSG